MSDTRVLMFPFCVSRLLPLCLDTDLYVAL